MCSSLVWTMGRFLNTEVGGQPPRRRIGPGDCFLLSRHLEDKTNGMLTAQIMLKRFFIPFDDYQFRSEASKYG